MTTDDTPPLTDEAVQSLLATAPPTIMQSALTDRLGPAS